MRKEIEIKNARENNLKNLSVKIPRDKFVVLTGLSGSGKSSLAFDTIFAEGQRRYMESLSSYARQFLGQFTKPDVDYIEGLSPAISIDQKTTSKNPRSTVGTVTEIYDYLRLLYARIGIPHCPQCGKLISQQTLDQICDRIKEMEQGAKIMIMAPVVRGRKGEYIRLLDSFKRSGYARVKVDDIVYDLSEEIHLDKNIRHNISVIIDRLVIKADMDSRLTDSVEAALKLAEGLIVVDHEGKEYLYSTKYSCPDCELSIEELEPRLFSFNSPFGACADCHGLGFKKEIDVDKVVKWNLSVEDGALNISGWNMDTGKIAEGMFRSLSKKFNFPLDIPVKDLPKEIIDILLYGSRGEKFDMEFHGKNSHFYYKSEYEGIINNLLRRYKETESDYIKTEIEKYMIETPCGDCGGMRLKKDALSVTIGGLNISELCAMSIDNAVKFFAGLKLTATEEMIAAQIIKEINARLHFLLNVGLNYLTLARSSGTLSGGESQRIRLATQIGSGLVGVLYILDEPSIGLHQKDNGKLLNTLKRLRDIGNTLIVVEHDEETIMEADHIIDIGPGAGIHGGEVVCEGTPGEIMKCETSLTGQYLSGRRKIAVPSLRRQPDGRYIEITGAKENNLKNIGVNIPVGLFTSVTGVSGSGKSSLIKGILYPHLMNEISGSHMKAGKCDAVKGIEYFDKVINIDQSPIGRTPRSNPATYTGVFNLIRDLFANTPDAKARGYEAGRFSFNIKGGRCENCGGDGIIKIEMHFLPDVYVPCEVCKTRRYNRETLEVKYKGKNIHDVLEMTIEQACGFFEPIPRIYEKIKTMFDVGLGYIKLGQAATTLSGGEAQRVKLATELSKRSTGKTVYILDEPTTGLHTHDVDKLIVILQRLAGSGNTVIVIEHNLDVIKVSDFIIDLGPEGGDKGGTVICSGTPEQVAECSGSATGQYLKKILTHCDGC